MKKRLSWPVPTLSDAAVVERVLSGEAGLFEILIRRYNQRLYRTAMSIVQDNDEAQEILQETYLKAFQHLGQFEGRSQLATWLTRIAINESLARLGKRSKVSELDLHEELGDLLVSSHPAPEQRLVNRSLHELLEFAVGKLSPLYRSVFILREIESLSTVETARCLDLSEEAVKVRLHRARAFLRKEIQFHAGITSKTLYEFMGTLCDQMTERVMEALLRL